MARCASHSKGTGQHLGTAGRQLCTPLTLPRVKIRCTEPSHAGGCERLRHHQAQPLVWGAILGGARRGVSPRHRWPQGERSASTWHAVAGGRGMRSGRPALHALCRAALEAGLVPGRHLMGHHAHRALAGVHARITGCMVTQGGACRQVCEQPSEAAAQQLYNDECERES